MNIKAVYHEIKRYYAYGFQIIFIENLRKLYLKSYMYSSTKKMLSRVKNCDTTLCVYVTIVGQACLTA